MLLERGDKTLVGQAGGVSQDSRGQPPVNQSSPKFTKSSSPARLCGWPRTAGSLTGRTTAQNANSDHLKFPQRLKKDALCQEAIAGECGQLPRCERGVAFLFSPITCFFFPSEFLSHWALLPVARLLAGTEGVEASLGEPRPRMRTIVGALRLPSLD